MPAARGPPRPPESRPAPPFESGLEPQLHHRGGDVAAGPLEDGPEGVGGAPQPAGDGVGVVDAVRAS